MAKVKYRSTKKLFDQSKEYLDPLNEECSELTIKHLRLVGKLSFETIREKKGAPHAHTSDLYVLLSRTG